MSGALAASVGFAAIGGVSVFAGAVLATRFDLGAGARSMVQHAAAGTVLAGLVVDVFAKLLARPGQVGFTAVGMVLGLAGMLLIRVKLGGEGEAGTGGAWRSLVVTVLTDIVVDGVLIGLSAALVPAPDCCSPWRWPRRWDCWVSPRPRRWDGGGRAGACSWPRRWSASRSPRQAGSAGSLPVGRPGW